MVLVLPVVPEPEEPLVPVADPGVELVVDEPPQPATRVASAARNPKAISDLRMAAIIRINLKRRFAAS